MMFSVRKSHDAARNGLLMKLALCLGLVVALAVGCERKPREKRARRKGTGRRG